MGKERYFIKCDCCDEPIYFEENLYVIEGFSGTYCCPMCVCNAIATLKTMSVFQADYYGCNIYKEGDDKVPLSDDEVRELLKTEVCEDE